MTGVVVELCSKLHTDQHCSESSLSGHNGYLVRGVLSSEFVMQRCVLIEMFYCKYSVYTFTVYTAHHIHSTSCT